MKRILLFFLFLLLPIKVLKAGDLPILISQIMIGQNEGVKNEFVELYNPNNYKINLDNYSLKKKTSSGSESNLLSAKNFKGQIPGDGYFLISSKEYCQTINADLCYSSTASLSKNNTLLLYDDNKNLSDKLGYGGASDFFKQVYPEIENNKVLKRKKINLENPDNSEDFSVIEDNIEILNSKGEIIKINNYFSREEKSQNKTTNKTNKKTRESINISEIKKLNNGDLVKVEGVVANLPGQFGSQYFYIIEEKNSDEKQAFIFGVQIYNYNKNFPDLRIGDKVSVLGEIVNKVYNWKIKTKEMQNISILSVENKINNQKEISIKKLSPQNNGSLVQVKGVIVQNKTNAIYLDDGEDEILIDIKKGTEIASKNLKEGRIYIISGILLGDEKKLKIMPLSEKSIQSLGNHEERMVGELITDDYLILEKENKEKEALKYILTITGVTAFYFIFEKKIKKFLK